MGRPPRPVSIDQVCLHLADGTADDWRTLRRSFGRDGWWSRPESLWRRAGLHPARAARLHELRDGRAAAREIERCRELGVDLVGFPDGGSYPDPLRRLDRPPLILCVRGRWPPPDLALAVVGARAATPYGRQAASALSAAASRAGVAIVSGLARGIDRAALEAALEQEGWPVAVLGCGVDVAYPPEHRALQAAIADRGTLVSEFPLGRRPTRFAFPRRNRILAALARAVLVVEAGERSGALITAAHALELGLDVLAVPGPIDAPQSRGTNRLIRDGAVPVLEAADLLAVLGMPAEAADAAAPDDPLLAALGPGARSVDELVGATGLPVARVRGALVALQIEGRVVALDGGRFAARRR